MYVHATFSAEHIAELFYGSDLQTLSALLQNIELYA